MCKTEATIQTQLMRARRQSTCWLFGSSTNDRSINRSRYPNKRSVRAFRAIVFVNSRVIFEINLHCKRRTKIKFTFRSDNICGIKGMQFKMFVCIYKLGHVLSKRKCNWECKFLNQFHQHPDGIEIRECDKRQWILRLLWHSLIDQYTYI